MSEIKKFEVLFWKEDDLLVGGEESRRRKQQSKNRPGETRPVGLRLTRGQAVDFDTLFYTSYLQGAPAGA